MSEQTKKVKRRPTSCGVTGATITSPFAYPLKSRKNQDSSRQIIMRAILLALEAGPATPAEINMRMGFKYSERTANLCRILERQKKVKRIADAHDAKPRGGGCSAPVGIYALILSPLPDKPRSNNKRHSVSSS